MNGPFHVAQADTSEAGGGGDKQHPRIVKVTKPYGDQSVVVSLSYDGSVRADLSSIASEKITLVHIGEKLIILFDNHSTVTLEPFFDSTGKPLHDVTVEVAPGRDITSAEFATLFPVTDDPSVLPAAGNGSGSGAQASGANFTSVGIDPLAPSNPIPLLGQEELPSFVINDIPTSGFINDRPKALSNDALIFDEDGLPGGNKGGIGDYDQSGNGPIFATGTLAHDYHRDADGVHESTLLLGTGAPSGFSYKLSDDGLVLTVSQIQNGSSVDVLRITLTDRISGQYTLQQLHAIDHAPGGNENDQVFTFRYRVTDSNGDTADGSLKLTVNDDSPVTAKNESVTFDEDALGGNLGGVGDYHESNNGPITATGTLSHSYGSDGAGTLLLTANGAPEGFHYSVNSSGTVLTVSQMQNGSSVDVIQVSLTDRFSGNYTVKQLHAIQHESGHDENNQDFTFTYVVTDHDSDSVTGTLSLTVNDDTPIIGVGVNQNSEGGRWTLTLDESIGGDRGGNGNGASDDVGSNKTPDPSGTHPIGEVTSRQFDLEDLFTISKSGGADGEKSVTYAYSLSLSGAGENTGVATTLRVTDGAGHYPNDTIYLFKVSDTEIVGRVGNDPNGAIALRITLTDPGDIDNGKIVIDQYMAIDHGSDGNDFDSTQLLKLVGENASLGVTLTGVITDGDNDQATSSATAVLADDQHSRIAIEDDGPSVRVSIDRHFEITIDETPGNQNDDVTGPLHVFDGVANRGDDPHEPGPVLAYARSDGAAATVSAVFGTDGPWHGSVSQATSYGLSVINGTDSGLATTEGREIFLFKEGDLIVGRYDSPTDGNTTVNGNDPAAFAIAIDPNTGVVSMVQYVSIKHPEIFDNDDQVTLNGKTVSVVVTVTDGDGDQASGSADISRAIHFDDDGPKITGRAISETVDEDDIKTPYATGTSPNDGNGDGSYTDSPSDNGSGPADVFGTLAGHVDFGADGPGAYAYRFISNATSTMAGLHLTSHGQDLHYSVSGDILTAYTTGAGGHTVFTLTVDHTTGNYAFKLYDSLDHVNANGQNTTLETGRWDLGQIDFGSILKATDGDGDSVTLAGQFTITIRDDVPVAHDVTAPKVLDDEAQSLFTPTNSGGNGDVSPNTNTFSGGDGSLFAPGADGIRSIAFTPPTGIEAIYKMGNGLAGQEGVHYTTTTSGDHTILTAIGNVSHNVVFTLDVDSDGSYTLKVSEPLVHPTSSTTEENLTIKVGFTVTDSDGDRDSGSLTFKVNDDTPTVDVDRAHDRRGDDVTLGTLTLDESIHQLPGDTNATSDNVSGVTGPAYPFLTAADPSKAIGIVSTPTSGQGTSLAGLFAVDVDFGADGAKAAAVKEYAFTLKNDYGQAVSAGSIHGVETNLVVTALAGTSLAGLSDNARTIYLFKEADGSIVGRIGDNPNGPIALHIVITDSGSGPKMSIEQYLPVEHGNHNSSDESAFLTFDDRDASLGITLTVTATDGDGDVASDSKTVTIADSRNSIIEIQDDGPRITGFSASGTVIQDETPGVTGADPNGSNDVASSGLPAGVLTLFDGVANKGVDTDVANAQKEHGAIGFATSQGSIVHVSADFGTDGAAINNSQVLSLAIAGGNGADSGLQTTDGHRIYLFIENGLIVGRYDGTDPGLGVTNGSYGSSVDPAAFAVALGQDGTISIAQYVSLNNPTPGSSDAAHDEAASGLKNIQATVTLTDGDGDRVSQTINISGNIVFQDDGPSLTVTAPAAINGLDFGTFALNGNAWGTGSGVAIGTNGGWTISDANDGHSANPIGNTGGGAVQLERVGDGYQGMHSSTNGYMVDLDASPHDVKISQVVNGLVTGQSYELRFEAGAPVPNSAHLEVWFGGVKIYDLDPNGQMTAYDIKIKGGFGDGSNLLEFRETGAPDNQGSYLANVSVGLIVIDESAGNQPNTNDVDPNSLFAAVAHKGVDPDMTAGPQFAAGTSAVVNVAANFGADGPWHGSVTEATIFSLSTTSGMDSGLTTTAGQSIHLFNEPYGGVGYVVGRFDSNGDQSITSADDAAFAFRIDPTTGVLSLVQYVSLHQPNIHSNNEGVFLNAGALSVSVTVTDGDGDTATKIVDVSANVSFLDDGPDLVVTAITGGGSGTAPEPGGSWVVVNPGNIDTAGTDLGGTGPVPLQQVGGIVVDESAGNQPITNDVDPNNLFNAVANKGTDADMTAGPQFAAGVSAAVNVAVNFGADGPWHGSVAEATVYTLSTFNGADSGLTTTAGQSIHLLNESYGGVGYVVGRFDSNGDQSITSADDAAFAFRIDPTTGVLSLVQYVSLHQFDTLSNNESAFLNAGSLSVSVTVTDGDGDTATRSADISANVRFDDDGPHADLVATSTALTIDETAGQDASTDDVADIAAHAALFSSIPGTPIEIAQSQAAVVSATGTIYGADGQGAAPVFALNLSGGNGIDSGLDATDGRSVFLYKEGSLIVGREGTSGGTADSNGKVAFAISLDGSSGVLTVAEYIALYHHNPADPNEAASPLTLADNLIQASVTVTDGDGDTSVASVGIGNQIHFLDDGPSVAPAPLNQIVNGQFVEGVWSDPVWWGSMSTSVDGWAIGPSPTGGYTVDLERSPNGYLGMTTSNGAEMVDMGSSPGNIQITQQFSSLTAGQTYAIQFEAGAPFPKTAELQVLWNGQVIGTIHPSGPGALTSYNYIVTTNGTSDALTFREIGTGNAKIDQTWDGHDLMTEDYHGTYLANVGLVATYVVDEDGLAAGNHDLPVPSEGDALGTATSVIGDLHINWGADNYDSSTADTSDANRFYQDGGTLIGRSVTFTSADIGVSGGLSPTSLTSHGDSVVVTLDDAGTHLVGTAIHDGVSRVVFEVSLSDDGTGAFKFTLHDALDHAPNGSENDINITFHFTATDSDGDTATGTFMVGVDDDMPVALGGNIDAGTVYEDGLSDGNPEAGHTATSVTIHAADLAHLVNFGADGPGGIGFNQAANGTLSGLTSDGSAISYKIVGDTLSGVTADNRTIFTLVDDGAGNFVFTLLDNVDHPANGDSGTLTFNLASLFAATDADGDSVVLTGGVNVTIENDVPLVATQANLIVNGSFEDGHGLSGGQWSIYHTLDGGWTTGADGVPFEVQVGGPGGVPAQDGSALVELDSDFTGGSLSGDNHVNTTGHTNSTIQQAIAGTEAGQTYEVTFWYAPRPNEGDADSGSMDVLWNGQVVKTIDSARMTPGVWQQITVFVEGTGPGNTLGFHATGQENSLGALIDNVSLVAAVVVDEDGLAGPNAFGNHDSHQPGDIDVPNADHDGNEATATGLLNIKWGADSADHGADSTTGTYGTLAQDHPGGNGNRSVTFDSSPLAGFGGTLTSGHLTSHGEEIQLSFNADRTVLYGTAGAAGVDARTVFEVSLSDDGSGSFRFVLLDQLDHAAGQNENNIALSFNYVATDSDGDHASGTFTVVVNDDVPVAHADTGSVTEGGELVVAAANGVLYNDAFGADGKDAGGGVVGIEAGATAGGTNAQVGSGVHGAHGTLTLGADGHYSYQLDSGVAESLAKGQTLTDVFTYTMSDGDGDTSSATLTLTITGTNHTPEITVTPTDPVGGYNLVDEAGLPTGSNAAALSEYAHGTIHLTDADGSLDIKTLTVSLGGSSQQVTINDITGPGTQTFDFTSGDAHGTLVISDYDAGTGAANYTYTLTKPVHDTVPNNDADVVSPGDTFKLTVTDADGATGTANLVIDIRDDVPTARGDTDSVGTGTTTDGNVITGADTTSGALGKDTLGADGAHVSSAYGKDGAGSAKPVGTDTVIDGAYGQLKISSDGHYTYTRTSGSMGGVDDVFNYTLTDGDGDTSPATLTIKIGDSTPTIGSNTPDAGGDTARVFEAGLASTTADRINEPAGSHVGESAYPTTAGGTIAFTSVDGVAGVKLNTTSLSSDSSHPTVIHDGMTGDLSAWYSYNPTTGTGAIHYSYTLLDNTLVDPSPRIFSVAVTDADGDAAPAGSLTVTIVDDVPHAVADAALTVLETAGATAGVNLLANDARGADGATVAGVNFNDGGGLHAIAASGVTTLPTANGTYTFQADGTWTFDPLVNPANSNTTGNFTYVITDGDGDTSSALQTVNITNANSTPTAGSQSITVDEDGLAGGIAATQPGDVTGAATTVSGTLIHNYSGDGAAASNAISFTSTGAVLDSLGHAVKSGGVALSYFYNASTHTLYGTTNPADATTAAANAAFKVVLTGSDLTTGNYTYTELKPLDHPGHDADGKNDGPETSYEDNLTINIGYQVKDSNGDTAGGTLSVIVNDDSPLATSQTKTVDENATVNTNLLLILDTSGSMGSGYPSGVTNAIKLDVLKAAVNELFEQYGNEGNVAVRIVSFSDNGVTQGNTWLSLADAKIIVKNLVADGSTNYADAINDAMTAFGSAGKLATGTVQNVAYFISDGAPNSGSGVNSSLENDWTDFLKDHDVTAYALGIGASVSTGPLDPIAYDGVTETNTSAQVVTDLNQLAQTLVGIATDATGNLVTGGSPAGGFGADGGHLQSITVGGETYTYNPAGSGSISGGTHGSFNATTHTLTVTLADGGKLSVNMESGAYTYSPPAVINSNFDVPVGFVLVDNDGDTAGNTLTIHVNNADRAPIVRDDHVITNLYGSGASISIPDYALLFNDKDADGQTITISGVSGALSGTVAQGTGVVTFTDGGFSSNGGSFIYTGTAGGKADTGTVTVDRAQAGNSTLNGTGLDDILLARNSATTLMGYEGNDVLIGGTKSDTLNGGKEADLLVGGGGTDTFIFAAGDSVLTIGGAGTSGTISGYDTIRDFAPGAAGTGERISYSGISVAGNTTANGTDSTLLLHTNAAVASHHIAGGVITFDDVNSFASAVQLTSMSDVAAVTQYLQGVDLGGNGRTLAFEATLGSVTHTFVFIQGSSDANDVLIDLNKVDASSISVSGGQLYVLGTVDSDPIVLDLDHNGFSFTPLADGVQFDINHDGAKDQVAWTKGHDGLLALDVNGNGKIDNGSELFTPDFAGGHFADGLAALASLDSNHDGIIDAADHDFAKLLVWQDVNHNGVSDAGELKGLADLGILSIDLATTPGTPIDGQSVPALGTFNYADGSKGSYAEVEFDTSFGEASDDHHGHTQTGTDGVADTFALATTETADTILHYNFAEGDKLDLSALLDTNFGPSSSPSDFVKLTQQGTDVHVQVDTNGPAGGAHFVDVAVLSNYSMSNADIVNAVFAGQEHQLHVTTT